MAKYLKKEELEVLVDYINNSLSAKANLADIPDGVELPADLVHTSDLANYAEKSELNGLVDESTLQDYAKKSEVVSQLPNDLVYSDDLNAYVLASQLENYALASDVQALEGRLTGVYHFKGSVADLNALQAIEDPQQGDVYNLEDTGMNAAWTGEVWDEFGTIVDLSPYVLSEDVQAITRAELDAILYSGKQAVVTDISGFKAMLENDEPEVAITLNKDMTVSETFAVPADKKVELNLAGNSINIASGKEIQVQGEMTIEGDGEINAAKWGITAYGENAKLTINNGHFEAAEAPISVQQGAELVINGGEFVGIDNCPIMGQGNSGQGNVNIVMNGGKLIAHITSAGYQACGVYMPNSGKFTMNGGEIISDGAGIVMRAGEVELNGGSITANGTSGVLGKVGDSKVTVGPYAVVYDEKANYPGLADGPIKLTIGKDMILNGTDGDISVLMPDGKDVSEANIIDNREDIQTEP